MITKPQARFRPDVVAYYEETLAGWARDAAFEEVLVRDVTAAMGPSLRRLHRLVKVLSPGASLLHRPSFRSEVQHANVTGSAAMWAALQRDLWSTFEFEEIEAAVTDALEIASDCKRAYKEAPADVRRLFNHTFFKKIFVDTDRVAGSERPTKSRSSWATRSPRGSRGSYPKPFFLALV